MPRRAHLDVTISSDQRAMRTPRKRLGGVIDFACRAEDADVAVVDVAVVTARRIAALNRRWLRHAGSTDVLSFDLTGPGDAGLVAQIVVCADVAVRESRRRGHSAQRELLLYAVHGLLHLIGYDDTTPPKAARMRVRQEELLDAYLAGCRGRR